MVSSVRNIIFDFDYTLADSSQGVIESVNYALIQLGLPQATPEKIRSTIGLSLPATLAELAGRQYAGLSDEFSRFFIQRADEVMVNRTVVLKGVPETLRMIKGQGYSTGIVSTKFRHRIESILGREGLLQWFDIIVGSEDVSVHKPNPEGLLTAIKRLGNRLEDSLYVGDSVVDAQTASRAGVRFAVVLSGVTPLEHFSPYRVDRILHGLADLPPFLQELNCRKNQGVSSC